MRLFHILFGFDVLALLVLVYFFADGLRYDPGDDYITMWIPILLIPAGVLAGASILRGKGKTTGANVLLGVMAAPFFLYLLFVGMFIVLQPDMR